MSRQFIYGVFVTCEHSELENNKYICYTAGQVRNVRRNFESVYFFEVYKLPDYMWVNRFLRAEIFLEFEPVMKNLWSDVSRETLLMRKE